MDAIVLRSQLLKFTANAQNTNRNHIPHKNHSTEDAAARRALWFARHWEYVRPFLPPGAQSLTGDFAKKVSLYINTFPKITQVGRDFAESWASYLYKYT